jgi:UDP-glucose 4-epimerase
MSRVLVTGATTPTGVRVVELLLEDPETEAVLAVGSSAAFPGSVVASDAGDRLVYLQSDLTRARHVKRLLFGPAKDHGVDVLMHMTFHRNSFNEGPRIHELNVESTRLLVDLAERHETIERVIYQSSVEAYLIQPGRTTVLREDHPLDFSPHSIQAVRDRVESDLIMCTKMGVSPLTIQVLRCAEVMGYDTGSQLYDYLQSRVCYRPLGFDPMLNVLTVEDAARALCAAVAHNEQGVFNIAGYDTLPLSLAIAKWGRLDIPVPGPLLEPLYRWRTKYRGTQFRYDLNRRRFHFSTVLDGTRAREILGYVPENPIVWPTDE